MLNSQKVEDELNLALDATQSERERYVLPTVLWRAFTPPKHEPAPWRW